MLLSGPYYKFRTYIDMIKNENCRSIDTSTPLMARLRWLPFVGIAYVILSHFYYIEVTINYIFYEIFLEMTEFRNVD